MVFSEKNGKRRTILVGKSSYLNGAKIFSFIFLLFLFSCIDIGVAGTGASYRKTSGSVTDGSTVYRYLLYLPKHYAGQPYRKYPLLVYLHGKSCRGYNLEKLKRYGPPYLISKGWDFPFIIVSPQCPPDRIWSTDEWFPALYKSLSDKYRIDENRVYLTGMSMGGSGVWALAIKHPEYLAAAIPLCGGWRTKGIEAMKDIPVWAFHGSEDDIVPPEETGKMVEALRKAGGRVRYSRLEGQGHSIHRIYEYKEIYDWLLKQKN